jgi:hypothetical protein
MQRSESDIYALRLQERYADGLIVIGLIILQDFITLGTPDSSSFTSVLAFSISPPLLSSVLVLNIVEEKYEYGSPHPIIAKITHLTFVLGILVALAGVAAAFWHISWIAGVVFIVVVVVAFIIYSAYAVNLKTAEMENR